ncbi:hypothetical protein MKX03_015951 [Papaver bracteatum]|nr:hypothetical protein MKX03_015951 [Papaver bracteatum]
MNSWTDDNTSMMDAFMALDLSSPFAGANSWPTSSSASTITSDQQQQQQQQLQQPVVFNQETLQQRLQILIEGARESRTYAIFWQSSVDNTGVSFLGWGGAEQEHRKKVLRELSSLISGVPASADDPVDEEVTDTEWFFLVSMTQSFINGGGLLGQAFFSSYPVWLTGNDSLLSSACDRAKQAQLFGLQTMVCIPLANGVVELGSTEIIFQSSDLMNKVGILFIFNSENDPSLLWISEPTPVLEIKESSSFPPVVAEVSKPVIQHENHSSISLTENPSSSIVHVQTQTQIQTQTQTQTFFTRELNFSEYRFDGSSTKNISHHQPSSCKPESGVILRFGDSSKRNSSSVVNGNIFSNNSQFAQDDKKKKKSVTSKGSNNDQGCFHLHLVLSYLLLLQEVILCQQQATVKKSSRLYTQEQLRSALASRVADHR